MRIRPDRWSTFRRAGLAVILATLLAPAEGRGAEGEPSAAPADPLEAPGTRDPGGNGQAPPGTDAAAEASLAPASAAPTAPAPRDGERADADATVGTASQPEAEATEAPPAESPAAQLPEAAAAEAPADGSSSELPAGEAPATPETPAAAEGSAAPAGGSSSEPPAGEAPATELPQTPAADEEAAPADGSSSERAAEKPPATAGGASAAEAPAGGAAESGPPRAAPPAAEGAGEEAPATGSTPTSEEAGTGSAEAPAVAGAVDELQRRDQRPEVVIKTILGLIALLALAYLGGHPRMRRIEHRLRISQVVTAGFPFVALGAIAALPSVGVLTHTVLDELTPLLRFGLGWIGFVTGHRFETRRFDDLPKGTASAVAFATGLPFLTVVAAASLLLLLSSEWSEVNFQDPVFLRDALILGTAGAMTARTATRLVNGGGSSLAISRLSRIIQLEQFAGIAGLAFIAAYFRPTGPDIGWQLPGTAWLFLTIGLGATIGILAYVLLRRPASGAESVVLLLGMVAFASGLASTLHLSPIVVCFVAGVLLANFPSDSKAKLSEALTKLERPIYLLFLVMVGAILEIDDWRGWVLGGVFVLARLVGKWLAVHSIVRYTDFDSNADENWVATRGPIGQLAIAIVVSAQLLFPQGSIPIIVTAVLTGAIVTEILVQILARGGSSKGGAKAAEGAPPAGAAPGPPTPTPAPAGPKPGGLP